MEQTADGDKVLVLRGWVWVGYVWRGTYRGGGYADGTAGDEGDSVVCAAGSGGVLGTGGDSGVVVREELGAEKGGVNVLLGRGQGCVDARAGGVPGVELLDIEYGAGRGGKERCAMTKGERVVDAWRKSRGSMAYLSELVDRALERADMREGGVEGELPDDMVMWIDAAGRWAAWSGDTGVVYGWREGRGWHPVRRDTPLFTRWIENGCRDGLARRIGLETGDE